MNQREIYLPVPSREIRRQSDLHITFVHTPMSNIEVEGRNEMFEAFDRRYYLTHPQQKPTEGNLWELPHWMNWLGGVLVDQGFSNLEALDLFDTQRVLDNRNLVDKGRVKTILKEYVSSDVYLFSPVTSNLHHALSIAEAIKETNPNCKIIFGGVVATPLKEEVAIYPSVDFVVFDRGEVALPVLLKAIEKGQNPDISEAGNLVYWHDGELRKSTGRYKELAPSDLPFPKVDLLPETLGTHMRYLRQVHILGCPYKCSYCTIPTNGRKPDQFPFERNLKEIDEYNRYYGKHNIYWGDETFDPKKAWPLLTALKERGDVISDFQTRIGYLTKKEWVGMLRKSGFVWAEVGVETVDQNTRRFNKGSGQDVSDNGIEEVFKMVRDEGIAICLYTVNGLPPQTPDQMERSMEKVCEWIAKGLVTAAYHNGLVPYPGSDLYNNPKAHGLELIHKDYSLYNQSLPPVFVTDQAKDPDKVYQAYLRNIKRLRQAMS